VIERKPHKKRVQPTTAPDQDLDAQSLPTGRRSAPIRYRIELVAVPGDEGETLLKIQQAAVLNALRWAVANRAETATSELGT
jgi:hypothetical protein